MAGIFVWILALSLSIMRHFYGGQFRRWCWCFLLLPWHGRLPNTWRHAGTVKTPDILTAEK